MKYKVSLQYRDAANWKFWPDFEVSAVLIQNLLKARGLIDPQELVGRELNYPEELGISQLEFHRAIGYPPGSDDHPYVTIEAIEALTT
jgi:hypothetical protein